MKCFFLYILTFVFPVLLFSQGEFHVFPIDHDNSAGSPTGDGSLSRPWDLQTALSQPNSVINGGDTIWIHGGIYKGRFFSLLNSDIPEKHIIVNAFGQEKVVIDGNVKSKLTSVLDIRGKLVSFRNIEITFLGDFSRKQGDATFQKVDGVNHLSGINCQFINLKIHNNPGSGFGSWKRAGGSLIKNCIIFNNGYYSTKRGSGVGIYVQNQSEQIRVISNNLIFNNYYKGIEVWSAAKNAKSAYVKNVRMEQNVIFNNGLTAGRFRDNLIIATDDRNGVNLAKNIAVLGNIFYHNTDFLNNQVNGDAPSLTLGYYSKAPLENVIVKNNIIIGRNNALRFNNATNLEFKDNIVYCGYVHLNASILENISKWRFNNNTYYSKRNVPIRISKHKDYKLYDWQKELGVDKNSEWKHLKEFNLDPVLRIWQPDPDKTEFRVVLFSKTGQDVIIDFSKYDLNNNTNYIIKNIASNESIASGTVTSKSVRVSMGKENSTLNNFGVYAIEFSAQKKKKKGFLNRFFQWLF